MSSAASIEPTAQHRRTIAIDTDIMAGIVNRPLAIFRRPDSPKPLHSRWGDTSISVPTDGSWNQYDNPHRPSPPRQVYGPGFVPDCSPSDRTTKPLSYEDPDKENKSTSANSANRSHRNSLSLGALRPGRLSVRLASRPKRLRGETPSERESRQSEEKKAEFAYKPIHQDYPAEVTENTHAPRYRYIPTSGRYVEDIKGTVPRSQSATSYRSSRARRDSFSESYVGRDVVRESYVQPSVRTSSYQEDDRRSLRSSLGDSSDSSGSRLSGYGLPPRRRASPFVAPDRKRSSSLKPMTLTMVPDPDELYE